MEVANKLNEDILQITMTIRDEYPELSKYLDEMSATIPDETDPEITLKHLKAYYNELLAMLNKYKNNSPTA